MSPKRFAAAFLVLAGCAAALQAKKKTPGIIENGQFKPQRPAAASYGADPALTCPEFGANGALETDLETRAQGGKRARPDGRLCAIADTLLGWKTADEHEMPPEAARAFLAHYFGLPGTVRQLLLATVETEDPKNVSQSVLESVASFASTAERPAYGFITERVRKGVTRVSLVLYDDVAQIAPLPRALAANSSATLSGTLPADYTSPRVEVVDPVGGMEKTPETPGQAFKAEVKCGTHAGTVLVQILGQKDGAEMAATSFPVWCGLQPPVAVKMPSETGPVDVAAAEKQLFEMVNADRTQAGVKPINALPALGPIARHLAEVRASGKGVSSSELTQSIRDADVAAPVVLLSMAQSFTIDDAYNRLSESPGDRANTMNPDVTDVGVGVAKGPAVGDKPTYIVAELFIKQRPPADAAQIKSKLYDAIARKRADARIEPATRDATLEGVAQAYAAAAAEGEGRVPREKESELLGPLYKGSITVNQLGGFVPDETSAVEVAEQPTIVGNAKLVGVGVAIGKSPQFGKGSPFVVVMMGVRHEAPKKVGKRKGKR